MPAVVRSFDWEEQPPLPVPLSRRYQDRGAIVFNPLTRVLSRRSRMEPLSGYSQIVAEGFGAASFNGTSTSFLEIPNSTEAFSGGATIITAGRRNVSAGIQPLAARGSGTVPGGFEIALYNQFGGTPGRIWSSYHNGTSQGPFQAGYVNGFADSLDGTLNTAQGAWYTVVAYAANLPACANQLRLGMIEAASPSPWYGQVDVGFVAMVQGRMPNEEMRALSINPWRLFA